MDAERDAFEQLCAYTLTHGDSSFVHQHVVDVFGAQRANPQTKPIQLTFSLAGLYLQIEKQFTGRQVQQAHALLAQAKPAWPAIALPEERGSITVADVLAASPGIARDQAIEAWCRSVWEAFHKSHKTVSDFVRTNLDFSAPTLRR